MKIARISGLLLLLIHISIIGMQRPPEVQQKINAIKDRYQLRQYPENKIPISCLTQQNHVGLACFVSGYQSVYVTPTQNIRSLDKDQQALFSHLNVRQIAVGNDTIFYTPDGLRNALLLAKLKLSDAVAGLYPNPVVLAKNQYLIRSLLGYLKTDIKNAYIDEAFAHWYGNVIKGPALDTLKRQKTLEEFTKDTWQNTNDYHTYLSDKINAEEWLQEQSDKNIQHLEHQITSLKEQLSKQTSYLQRLKTWWSTSPSSTNWTKWWQQ